LPKCGGDEEGNEDLVVAEKILQYHDEKHKQQVIQKPADEIPKSIFRHGTPSPPIKTVEAGMSDTGQHHRSCHENSHYAQIRYLCIGCGDRALHMAVHMRGKNRKYEIGICFVRENEKYQR